MNYLLLVPVAVACLIVIAVPFVFAWLDRPLTPTDRRLGRVDRELSEIEHMPGGGWRVR